MSRAWIILTGAIGCLGLVAPFLYPARPRLLWNASASVPIGLYRIDPLGAPFHGLMVAVQPPQRVARFAAARGYLTVGTPLIKRIVGVSGDLLCRTGRVLWINGRWVGDALLRDRRHRPLPAWQGCVRLRDGDVFVMNPTVRDSFDGRYFGVVPVSALVGRVTPLWTPALSASAHAGGASAFRSPTEGD